MFSPGFIFRQYSIGVPRSAFRGTAYIIDDHRVMYKFHMICLYHAIMNDRRAALDKRAYLLILQAFTEFVNMYPHKDAVRYPFLSLFLFPAVTVPVHPLSTPLPVIPYRRS